MEEYRLKDFVVHNTKDGLRIACGEPYKMTGKILTKQEIKEIIDYLNKYINS
jgi:DNA-directed RNA polymerase subunit F